MSDPKAPEDTLVDVGVGSAHLKRHGPLAMHWLAPWPGSGPSMSAALQSEIGVGLPGPGQVLTAPGVRCLWAGRDAAFLEVADVPAGLDSHGAVVDVSDGWVRFSLSGPACADVLARLCPVDLRGSLYQEPTALRTSVGHVAALIVAGQPEIEIWVMRSFAVSVQSELRHAMEGVAARDSLHA